MYRYLFLFLFLLLNFSGFCQENTYQKLVLEEVFNDKSIHKFFEDKKPLYLVDNENCTWEAGNSLKIGNQEVKIVPQDSDHQKVLLFTKYTTSADTISVELSLFHENTIYVATYQKDGGDITTISNQLLFIQQEPDVESMIQTILNSSEFEKYLHPEIDNRKQLYLLDDEYTFRNLSISKFGNRIKVIDDTTGTMGNYLRVSELEILNRKVNFGIYYKFENISADGVLRKIDGKWHLYEINIFEF